LSPNLHRRPAIVSASIAMALAALAVAWLVTRQGTEPVSQPPPSDTREPWTLAWSDEFDGPAGAPADPEHWTYETGGSGWGNEELQYYTSGPQNAALDGDGRLVLTVRAIDPSTTDLGCWYGPCTHTSARLVTRDKVQLQYGRIESRIRVPDGGGIWSALWMLGTDIGDVGWPGSGEIDLMEFVGRSPGTVFGTLHGPGYEGGSSFGRSYDVGAPLSDGWHEFAIEWSPGRIVWEVDGVAYHSATPADVAPDPWVFEHPFFVLLNAAVGGNFGGDVDPSVDYPQELVVDFVRAFVRT
jgi:beta-glucanase (GH16 family)